MVRPPRRPAIDEARALLKSYLSARAGSASGVFLVSGEAASGGRVVRLAEADELERTRAGFASVTTEQLYSVHAPALASDASRKYEPLASLAAAQDAQLYEEVRQHASPRPRRGAVPAGSRATQPRAAPARPPPAAPGERRDQLPARQLLGGDPVRENGVGRGHARAAHTRERGPVCAGPARARDKTADSTATRHDPKGLLTNRPGPGKRLRTQVRGGDDLVAGRSRTAARSRPSARERGAQAAPCRQAGLRPAAAKDPKGCGGHVCRKAALQAEGRAGGQAF